MAYSDFTTLEKACRAFALSVDDETELFRDVPPVPIIRVPPSWRSFCSSRESGV